MTQKVFRSQLAGVTNFDDMVKKHAQDLREYREHLETTKGKPTYPPPDMPNVVDICVRKSDLVPDYELIEDVQEPPSELRQHKNRLLSLIETVHSKAQEKIIPPGKRLIMSINYQDAMAKLANGKDERTSSEKQLCQEHEKRMAQLDKIHRQIAQLQSDVEDLNDSNIHKWKMPEL